jgi:hypothetical protein
MRGRPCLPGLQSAHGLPARRPIRKQIMQHLDNDKDAAAGDAPIRIDVDAGRRALFALSASARLGLLSGGRGACSRGSSGDVYGRWTERHRDPQLRAEPRISGSRVLPARRRPPPRRQRDHRTRPPRQRHWWTSCPVHHAKYSPLRRRDRQRRTGARPVSALRPGSGEGRTPDDQSSRKLHHRGAGRRPGRPQRAVRRFRQRRQLPSRSVHLRGCRRDGL